MTTPLVECVPNFSEARRPEIMDEIIQVIAGVNGVHVLDRHSDIDHNRTVVTFVGSPAGVEAAAFLSIAKAAELIDLNEHSGEHPRIGATDVVPFVPISNVTMSECVDIANRLGKRVGEELKIPVYLYEEAATTPERRNLAAIRKGEFEILKEAITTDPKRAPDFGPKTCGPAGATVIGAREFLVAFNVYLTTNDIEIARNIARTIRFSSGGLRYVKALGLLVEGKAQVSMNLTNFRKTPVALVVETIRREARRYGVGISHSELVGLIPQDAMIDLAVWYTQMDLFEPSQVLERRLYAAMESDKRPVEEAPEPPTRPVIESPTFLDELAAATPTPGGGSAAAYGGAMAAGLVAMVARLTLGKQKYADIESQMQSILTETERLREILTVAVEADSAAFEEVMAAYRLPRDTDDQKNVREAAIQEATLEAAKIPLETARKTLRVMQLALQTASLGSTSAITDAGTAATMAHAAITGAGYNVRINTLGMKDPQQIKELLDDLSGIEKRAAHFSTQMINTLKERGGLPL